MVEDVGAKLWHMDMAISMYSMWTRDPENDFSILIMPSDQTFNVNRLGKRYVNEMRIGSPATTDGMRSPTSMTRSAITTASRRGASSTRAASTPARCPRARATGSNAGTSPPCCPDELRDWDGWSHDSQTEVDKAGSSKPTRSRLAGQDEGHRQVDGSDTLKATVDTWNQVFCEAQKDPFRPLEKTLCPRWTTRRSTPSPSTPARAPAGRRHEERARPGARREPHPVFAEQPIRVCTAPAATATSIRRISPTASPGTRNPVAENIRLGPPFPRPRQRETVARRVGRNRPTTTERD